MTTNNGTMLDLQDFIINETVNLEVEILCNNVPCGRQGT